MAQSQRRKIEIFMAGCATCREAIDMVRRIAGSDHDLEIHDMQQAHVAARAKQHGEPAGRRYRRQARRVLHWAGA